jgi:hypothetical protein
VLPEGYPYVGEGYILPETTVEYGGEGELFLPDVIEVTNGESYTINWNGTAYKCVAQNWDIEEGVSAPTLGNLGLVMEGTDTGEPFVIAAFTADIAAMLGAGMMVYVLDGSTSVTLSVSGESVTKMDSKFMPDDFVVTYTKADETAVGNSYEVNGNFTYEQITSAIEAGKQVKAVYLDETQGLPMKIYFSLAANMPGNGVIFSTLYALDTISVMTIVVAANGATLSGMTVTGT